MNTRFDKLRRLSVWMSPLLLASILGCNGNSSTASNANTAAPAQTINQVNSNGSAVENTTLSKPLNSESELKKFCDSLPAGSESALDQSFLFPLGLASNSSALNGLNAPEADHRNASISGSCKPGAMHLEIVGEGESSASLLRFNYVLSAALKPIAHASSIETGNGEKPRDTATVSGNASEFQMNRPGSFSFQYSSSKKVTVSLTVNYQLPEGSAHSGNIEISVKSSTINMDSLNFSTEN